MTYDPKKHHRRSIRWYGYDYAQAGWYFVTVCTQGHVCLFGRVVDGQMRLNDAGRMVQAVWNQLVDHYARVQTDAFIVMPNHIHGIIELTADGAVGGVLSLADVVHRFKTLATKRYIDGVNQCGWSAFPGRLWQRNYHEHVIRSERSLNRIRQYIADNPARWADDPENPDTSQA